MVVNISNDCEKLFSQQASIFLITSCMFIYGSPAGGCASIITSVAVFMPHT